MVSSIAKKVNAWRVAPFMVAIWCFGDHSFFHFLGYLERSIIKEFRRKTFLEVLSSVVFMRIARSTMNRKEFSKLKLDNILHN